MYREFLSKPKPTRKELLQLIFTASAVDCFSYWERLEQKEKRATEDETVRWHHQLKGHEFEQTQGDSEGQASLMCCSSWGGRESDMTWRLNNIKGEMYIFIFFYNWILLPHSI